MLELSVDRTHRLKVGKTDQWIQALEDRESMHIKGLVIYMCSKDQLCGGECASINQIGLGKEEAMPHEFSIPDHLAEGLLAKARPRTAQRMSMQIAYERSLYMGISYNPREILERFSDDDVQDVLWYDEPAKNVRWYYGDGNEWKPMAQELSDLIEEFAAEGSTIFTVDIDERKDRWYEYNLEEYTQTRCTCPAGVTGVRR